MKLVTFNDIKNMEIPYSSCYDWAEEIIRRKKETILPAKISIKTSEKSFYNVMPCALTLDEFEDVQMGGVKIITRNPVRNPSMDSLLLLYDFKSGDKIALMDADWITAMRTGAVAAHSIMTFGKKDFSEISIMGLGNTARASLLILADKLQNRQMRVKLLRYKDQAELFIKRFEGYSNLSFIVVDSYDELVRDAEILLSCVTYLAEDICTNQSYAEGITVIPVHTRGFSNCDLFFDRVFADDLGHVCHFKNYDKREFNEVSDVVNGICIGRGSDKERILVYNIGLAIHDINYALHIYEKLVERGLWYKLPDIDFQNPTTKFWV